MGNNKETKETKDKNIPEDYAIQFFSKDLIGITANTTVRKRKYDRQQVRNFLKDPFKNYDKLQDVSVYLKSVSGNYFRIIKYLSGLTTFDYYIYPNSKAKLENKDKILNDYKKAAQILEKINIKYNFRWIFERLIENGEVYLYELEDSKGIIYKEIPYNICRISAIDNGVYLYEINLNKINKKDIDVFPVEIQNAFNNKEKYKDNNFWYPVSDKGIAFNAIGNYAHGFPVLCFIFDDVMGLDDTKDLIESKQKLDAIKLIHQKIPLDKDSKQPIFDMDIARIYHNATKKNLPDGVAVTTNPLEISQIPFDKTVTREIDTIERAERNIWNSSGISDLIFNNNKASGEALKRSIIADETLVFPFLCMFENYINKKIENTKFSMKFLETSYFNRDEKIKFNKDLLAYGSSRTYLLALMGLEPIEIINLFAFEQGILDIDKMLVPKQTSHTMPGDNEDEGGRPTQEEVGEEVKENTEIDRDSQ